MRIRPLVFAMFVVAVFLAPVAIASSAGLWATTGQPGAEAGGGGGNGGGEGGGGGGGGGGNGGGEGAAVVVVEAAAGPSAPVMPEAG